MHSIKYLSGVSILHSICIMIARSRVGKYKAIKHTLVRFCNKSPWKGGGGGGGDQVKME